MKAFIPVILKTLGSTLLMSSVAVSVAAKTSPKPLQAEAELGVLLTAGNTDSTASSTRLDVKQDFASWRNHYVFEGLYKEDQIDYVVEDVVIEESQVSAERYFVSAQTDYKLDAEYKGLFLFGSYDKDRFSGYDFQGAIAAGYSNRWFTNEKSFFEYSIGPGYAFARTDETINNSGEFVDNESESSAMVRLSADYQYEFSKNAKFTQSFASDAALESGANTKSKSVSAVTANINKSFALKASLTITHNSEVPEARNNKDSTTALTVVYSF
jgi:putative salt-induced outer membrane protein